MSGTLATLLGLRGFVKILKYLSIDIFGKVRYTYTVPVRVGTVCRGVEQPGSSFGS